MEKERNIIEEEKAKTKALARVRTFYFLIAVNIALIIYLAIQVMILSGK